jgi:hypothetical protein
MDIEFRLTRNHIRLLRRMYIEWRGMPREPEQGCASVNIKRPYGDSSVLGSIAEILGLTLYLDKDGAAMDPKARAIALRMHREMEMALQIVLATGSFRPGVYRGRFTKWRHVGPKKRRGAGRAA